MDALRDEMDSDEESEGEEIGDVVTEPSENDDNDNAQDVDEDGISFDDEMDEDDMAEAPRFEDRAFPGVEMIMPRRSFRGAKNIETVKDCKCRHMTNFDSCSDGISQDPR